MFELDKRRYGWKDASMKIAIERLLFLRHEQGGVDERR